jgi:uncharacterized cupredoxin-like copper-binding protein
VRGSIRKPLRGLVLAGVGLTLALPAAAQHSGARHAGHTAPPTATAAADVGAAAAGPRPSNADTTITIRTVGSNLEFTPSEIAVKTGQRLRIRYVNEGTFPHNVVVVKTEADIDPLGLAAFEASANGYIPATKADRMVAHSTLVPPGETVEFEFVVPEPGQYPFVCLYPGHYNMMIGTLRSLP